jgi:tRNA dimethylallyltransferase
MIWTFQLYLSGKEVVHQKLRSIDLNLAERIHPNNLRKVIRALEVHHNSGEAIKSFEESFIKTEDYDYILIGLTRNREELYNRINHRVDALIAKGLIQEVENLVDLGLTDLAVSMKGIGYKEIINCLLGDRDFDRAIDLIKQNTRHYAKRQMTWFKRYSDIKWFNLSDYQEQESFNEVQKWIVEKSEYTIKPTNLTI